MDRITMAHGSGGRITQQLIEDVFVKHFGSEALKKIDDSAIVGISGSKIAFTTDSFVVKPLFFPGGDIGKLAICGTVNDLAVSGAVPKYISCGLIIEEGLAVEDLEKIVVSIAYWAKQANVEIVTGDTKVVEKGSCDGIFINTSGVGVFERECCLAVENIKYGDKIIITGSIGDHGIAVLSKRKGLEFESEIQSDCAPLNNMLCEITVKTPGLRFMRDPTRGGLATTLNEITKGSDFGIIIEEEKIPVSDPVKGACELLGLDPLYIANEGKAIIIVSADDEKNVLNILKNHECGKEAAVIGEVTEEHAQTVCLKTRYGAVRIVDMLTAEHLPRIC